MLGFKSFASAAITIAGVELLHRFHKAQFSFSQLRLKDQAAPALWNAVLRPNLKHSRRQYPYPHQNLHQSRQHQVRHSKYQNREPVTRHVQLTENQLKQGRREPPGVSRKSLIVFRDRVSRNSDPSKRR